MVPEVDASEGSGCEVGAFGSEVCFGLHIHPNTLKYTLIHSNTLITLTYTHIHSHTLTYTVC